MMTYSNLGKIMVVDDSAVNRKVLAHMLVGMGFEVVGHTDGASAWADFCSSPAGTYAAIFSDMTMPEMDGLDLLAAVREHKEGAKIPFVMLSTVLDKELEAQAQALQVSCHLSKPVTEESITGILQQILPHRHVAMAA